MTQQSKSPFHCLVWIDHRQAGVYAVSEHDLCELAMIHAPDTGHGHVHHHAGTTGAGHEPLSPEFMRAVVAAIEDPAELLIAGPSDAKHALKQYIAARNPSLYGRILGVETLAKSSDHELQGFAHRFFHRADRIRPASL